MGTWVRKKIIILLKFRKYKWPTGRIPWAIFKKFSGCVGSFKDGYGLLNATFHPISAGVGMWGSTPENFTQILKCKRPTRAYPLGDFDEFLAFVSSFLRRHDVLKFEQIRSRS